MPGCALCGRAVDPEAIGVYQWTAGWVQRREGGGGHGISLAKREPRWAHRDCVERAVRGVLHQTELFKA